MSVTICKTCGLRIFRYQDPHKCPSVLSRSTPTESAGEGNLWSFLHDRLHEIYKKLREAGHSEKYHAMLDATASKLTDEVLARFASDLEAMRAEANKWRKQRDDLVCRARDLEALCAERKDALEASQQECERLREQLTWAVNNPDDPAYWLGSARQALTTGEK